MEGASKAATWIAFRSVIRRSLSTQTPTRRWPQASLQNSPVSRSTSALQIPRKHFSCTGANHQHPPQQPNHQHPNNDGNQPKPSKQQKRKPPRAQASTTSSLRRVAVEAQRSRSSLIKGKGKSRRVDPEADTREVTGYCAAETYDMEKARQALSREGFEPDPLHTGLYPQVLHVRTPNYLEKDEGTGEERMRGVGDVFVFPSGCVVAWNVKEVTARALVDRVLLPAAENGHAEKVVEEENLEYLEDPSKEGSTIIGDTIILGTKVATSSPDSNNSGGSNSHDHHGQDSSSTPEVDAILAKIAFSSALARSTKLAVLENLLSHYFSTTRSIPATLSAGAQLRFTRAFILRKTGELLGLRAQLNLYSELTDSLPDLFWDSPHELGLEGYYEMVGRALDVGVRIKVLNEKMDYASEIAAVLRERLSEKHSTGLEWMIIGLITIEVGFGMLQLWREGKEMGERSKTEELLQEFLERELGKKQAVVARS